MGTEQGPVRVYGPETWGTVAGCDWSWWDLWFCVIVVKDHGGNLAALQSLAGELAHRIRHLDRPEASKHAVGLPTADDQFQWSEQPHRYPKSDAFTPAPGALCQMQPVRDCVPTPAVTKSERRVGELFFGLRGIVVLIEPAPVNSFDPSIWGTA